MSTIASLIVKINGDNSGLRKELKATQNAIDKAFPRETNAFGSTIVKGAGLAAAALGAVSFASVKMAADMEQSRVAFTTMLGSAKKADSFLRNLAKFAASTPFDMPGLVDASKRMLAFGFSSKEIIPTLTSIGDAVAAVGGNAQTLDRVTLAFGQMRAAGRVTAQDMMQLTNAGIPAWEMLAKVAGKSIAEVRDLASKGQIDSVQAIDAMMKEMNSRFGGMMNEQSKTVTGIMSNIQDNVQSVMIAIGEDITDTFDLKDRLGGALADLDDFRARVETIGIRQAILNQVPAEAFGAAVGVIATAIYTTLIPALLKGMATAIAFVASLGPVGWAVAGVSAVVASDTWARAQDPEGYAASDAANIDALSDPVGYTPKFNNKPTQKDLEHMKLATKGDLVMADLLNEKIKDTEKNANKAASALITGAKKGGGATDKLASQVKKVSKSIYDEWVQTTQTQLEQLDTWHTDKLKELDDTKGANKNYQQDLLRLEETYKIRHKKLVYEEYRDRVEIARDAVDRIQELEDQRTRRNNFPKVHNTEGGVQTSAVAIRVQDIETGYRDQADNIKRHYEDLTAQFASLSERQKEDFIAAWTEAKYAFEITEEGTVNFTKQINTEILDAEKEKIEQLKAFNVEYLSWREQMDSAYNAGNIAGAIEQINSQQSLLEQDLEGRKEYIDAYYGWWKEAHRSTMSYMAEGYNALGNGMQSSIAGMIDGTMSLNEAWNNLGKTMLSSIAQMASQWISSRIMMGLVDEEFFGKKKIREEAAAATEAATITTTAATEIASIEAIAAAQVMADTSVSTAAIAQMGVLTAASIAQGAAMAAAWAPAEAAVSLATMGANAGPAMAGITSTHALSSSLSVLALATGGYVSGPGTGTSDSIPAMLSDGEYVINAKATAQHWPLIAAINNGQIPKYAEGGLITGPSLSSMSIGSMDLASMPNQKDSKITEQSSQFFNFHITAFDGKSVEKVLRKNGGALVRSLSDQAGLFNTGKLKPI